MNEIINKQYNNFVKEFAGVEAIITPEELKNLFSYVKDMETTMSQLTGELEAIKSKFGQPAEMGLGSKQEIFNINFIEKKQSAVNEIQNMFQELKSSVLDKAGDIRTCVHEKNLEGLNAILEKLNLKELCEKISKAIKTALEKTKHAEERVEYVEKELGRAKGHLKNATDPEMPVIAKEQKVEFKVIKSSFKRQAKLLSGMQEKTEALQNKMSDLDQKVKANKQERIEKSKEALCKSVRLKEKNQPAMVSMQRG